MAKEMAALHKRVKELEVARDNQAEIIRQFRTRGQVRFVLDENHAVYGTSGAVNNLRKRLGDA